VNKKSEGHKGKTIFQKTMKGRVLRITKDRKAEKHVETDREKKQLAWGMKQSPNHKVNLESAGSPSCLVTKDQQFQS
jgi:hypothetical protein